MKIILFTTILIVTAQMGCSFPVVIPWLQQQQQQSSFIVEYFVNWSRPPWYIVFGIIDSSENSSSESTENINNSTSTEELQSDEDSTVLSNETEE